MCVSFLQFSLRCLENYVSEKVMELGSMEYEDLAHDQN